MIICVSAHLQSRYWNVMQVMARTVRWKSPHHAGLSSVWRVSVCLQMQQPAESCRLTPHPPPPSSQQSVCCYQDLYLSRATTSTQYTVYTLHITQSPSMTTERTGCWPDCPDSVLSSAANRLIGEVVQSRRRPLRGPSPDWKRLLALSHIRHY